MLTPLTKNIKLHAPCKATPSDWAEGVGMISDLSLVCYMSICTWCIASTLFQQQSPEQNLDKSTSTDRQQKF